MAHFDEMTCLLYLDGQLDALRSGELELHARSCTPCRSLLAALDHESTFLRAAVTEEDESVPAHLLAPPQPDRVPWGWISAFGLASAGAYSLMGMVTSYTDQFSQAGFSSFHALGMAFSNALFWEGWSDAMTALVMISVAVLSLPLVWFGWKNLRRIKPAALVMAGLTLFLLTPAPAAATKIERGQQAYTLRSDETLKEDLIAVAGSVRIEGTVDGDLIVFAESVTITGRVTGDVLGFTRRLRVDGKVDGDIRAGANQIDIDGQVAHSVTAFSEGFQLSEKGTIGGSLIYFAAHSDLDGKVTRDVLAFTERMRVNGSVGGDMRIHINRATFGSTSSIGGKIYAQGRREPEILNDALRSKLDFKLDEKEGPDYSKPRFYWRQMLKYGAAFFFGLAMMLLMPGFYDNVIRQSKRYGPALGVGFLAAIATPILAIIACITLVGMALGIGSMMLWLVLYYSAQIAVGGWLGARLLGEAYDVPARIGRMALGLFVVRLALNLPEIAWIIWCLVVVWGMGAITLALFRAISASHDSVALAPATSAPIATT